MRRLFPSIHSLWTSTAIAFALIPAATLHAQASPQPFQAPPAPQPGAPFVFIPAPGPMPVLSPEVLELFKLETRFAAEVEAGGGKAFASWFADDGIALANGQPPIAGRANIAASSTWDPKVYQLTWIVQGAQMSSGKDMGFTWGRYTGHTLSPVDSTQTGRYLTIWKKDAGGRWKVAMEATAEAPPGGALTDPPPFHLTPHE